jgi:outer membrane protein assembly factor BamE (lipoprotein component of BamABCDE complex)
MAEVISMNLSFSMKPARVALLCVLLGLAACAQFTDKRGLEVTWSPADVQQFTRGESTRRDVLTALGPPSQVISLDDETVLYYLFEKSQGEALILLVYNRFDVDTRYDRAVFFFDQDELLTEFSTRVTQDDS